MTAILAAVNGKYCPVGTSSGDKCRCQGESRHSQDHGRVESRRISGACENFTALTYKAKSLFEVDSLGVELVFRECDVVRVAGNSNRVRDV